MKDSVKAYFDEKTGYYRFYVNGFEIPYLTDINISNKIDSLPEATISLLVEIVNQIPSETK